MLLLQENCKVLLILFEYFSLISVEFGYLKDKQEVADQKKSKFHQPEGDHLTLLAVYNSWKYHHFSQTWCYENFIQIRTLKRAQVRFCYIYSLYLFFYFYTQFNISKIFLRFKFIENY